MIFRFKIQRYLHQVLSGKWSEKKYFQKLTKLLKRKKPAPKEKRYCKGCLADVTDNMFCHCGERYLNKNSTYSEQYIRDMEPPIVKHIKWEFVVFAICLFSIFLIVLILSFL